MESKTNKQNPSLFKIDLNLDEVTRRAIVALLSVGCCCDRGNKIIHILLLSSLTGKIMFNNVQLI